MGNKIGSLTDGIGLNERDDFDETQAECLSSDIISFEDL